MPSGKLNNMIYRAALLLTPSPAAQLRHRSAGRSLTHAQRYTRILNRNRVQGASLLLRDGESEGLVFTSLADRKPCDERTLFRVASLTKMVTACAVLILCDQGAFALDDEARFLLPGEPEAIQGVTVRHLLSHTSGLRDMPAMDAALAKGDPFGTVLTSPGVIAARPGETFAYCNFGFGLLGCIIERATGKPVSEAIRDLVLTPLEMAGTLDASGLDKQRIMPITRVLSRHPALDVTVTPLGSIPLTAPDPERHFGHTAGALYTDAASLSHLLTMIAQGGIWNGRPVLRESTVRAMTSVQATYGRLSPTLSYGLGLVIIRDPRLSGEPLIGHQGFAYGCADGAFLEQDTGRQVVFLNGGCSEARVGRLGVCNRDVLRWALREELPSWK